MDCTVGLYWIFYRRNESSDCSCEKVIIDPINLTFIGEADQDDFIDILPGKDHLIIMRQNASQG